MVKGEGGGAGCYAESERTTKRTAAQDWHAAADVLPVLGLYVPAAQDRHAVEDEPPMLGLYVPAGQGMEALPLVGQYKPAGHASRVNVNLTPWRATLLSKLKQKPIKPPQ